MIFAALMLVLATWIVQQQASLLGPLSLIAILLLALGIWLSAYSPRISTALQHRSDLNKLRIGLVAFLVGMCWASAYAHWRLNDQLPVAWQQKNIELIGVVASVPEITERGSRFRFDVEKVLTPVAKVPAHISLNEYGELAKPGQLSDTDSAGFHAGERWQLTVRLKRPHGTVNPHGFDFEAWALAENIRATGSIKAKAPKIRLQELVYQPDYLLERVRERIRDRIANVLQTKPYRGVIQALVMGDDSQISQDDWQIFLRTGTTHLMSISGLHITMLSGLAFGIVGFCWRRVPVLVLSLPTRKAATLAGLVVALLYALIAGFSIPTQRTLYMLAVFAAVLWSGRQLAISQVLAIALVAVVLLDPWSMISAGFWLSFGAVALLAYALSARIGQIHWLHAALVTQWAVTIGMIPMLLMMFNQVSIVSPVANAFAIPLISFIVTPLALFGSFSNIDYLTLFSHEVLSAGMLMLKWLNQLPIATWQQQAPPAWTLVPAILGVLWLLLPRGWPMRWFGLIGLLPLFIVNTYKPALGDMKVTVLDVGQGLSVVIQTATHALLYDAGPKYNAQNDAGSRIIVPFLRAEGILRLNHFIVSHDDSDHSGGLHSIVDQMQVDKLTTSFEPDLAKLIPAGQCIAGQRWDWDQVRFEILYPDAENHADTSLKDNDRSCVLKITSDSGSILLTGDIEKFAEAALLASVPQALKSDVLIVPHHGSRTSSTFEFISAVAPQVSIFTVGYLNRFGHPKPSILERYESAGSHIYRSDQHGAIQLHFNQNSRNGETMSQETQHIRIDQWRNIHKRYWHEAPSPIKSIP
jgi:competence protein ComEC